ncbi:MAG TPA: hypothetical protein VNA29_04265 [Sphingomicrobium sp.]|nr:hypothetical protein [Sphingomicrobium sp.]
MKLYRVNKISAGKDQVLKKFDMLASCEREALQAAADSDNCPVCEVWSDGRKIGTVK